MITLWSNLIPIVLGSALVPIEIIITIMLLGTPGRIRSASAWVAGMITVRVLQGVVFGMILHWGTRSDSDRQQGWIVSTVLLVAAILFLVTATREIFSGDDPDAPPPKWVTMLTSVTPVKAFLIGAGVIAVSIKFWVFTFAAIGAIGGANLGRSVDVAVYLAFVLLVVSPHLIIVLAAALFPDHSKALLDKSLRWLQDHNRILMIALGLIFGVWFLIKALSGFGIL